jgi:hypothetical protein
VNPGEPGPRLAGCTCPVEQPKAADGIWHCAIGCPFHGLAVMQAEMEEAGLVDELGGGPIRVA